MRNTPLKAFASPLKQDDEKKEEVKYDLSKATVDGKTKEEILKEQIKKKEVITTPPSFIKPGVDGDPRNYYKTIKKPK